MALLAKCEIWTLPSVLRRPPKGSLASCWLAGFGIKEWPWLVWLRDGWHSIDHFVVCKAPKNIQKLRFEERESCEKCDFENVNFVENVTFVENATLKM